MTRGIVVAPAGSRFSVDAGAEDGWIYDIVAGIAAVEPDFRFTCITEQTDGPVPDSVHAVGIGRRQTEEVGGLPLGFWTGRPGLGGRFQVIPNFRSLPDPSASAWRRLTGHSGRQSRPATMDRRELATWFRLRIWDSHAWRRAKRVCPIATRWAD